MFLSRGNLLADGMRNRNGQGEYTVLFADLRDSTAMSELLSADEMVALLNAFLGALTRPIIAHGGVVDKFLGDGVMAVFGASASDASRGAISAVRAVLAMRRTVKALNDERVEHDEVPVRFGVGICTGEVIIARIGLPERSDVTAIGVTVNTAARLSGLCKTFGVDVVLAAETRAQLNGAEFAIRDLGAATVQGRSDPVAVSTLV